MIYLGNAFSIGMLSGEEAVLKIKEIDLQTAKEILMRGFQSIVGHEATASLLSRLLNIDIAFNRVPVKLGVGDKLLVFQLQARLPEGVVLSEEELKNLPHKWYLVTVEE